ncbi:MAG: chloride channel protein [Beijerinckiaceae bacterium]
MVTIPTDLPRRLARRSLPMLVPWKWRALVRASELGPILLAAIIGIVSGVLVSILAGTVQRAHEILFGLAPGTRLSAVGHLDALPILVFPTVGGLLLAAVTVLAARWRWRKRMPIDPIEANAVHGGRLSLIDSALVVVQNVISNGFGASVGMEAGYTQISSALASRLGVSFQMRRADLRTLVGCGSAAGIAAAFDAPLTGAFYAFELIIGSYSIANLAPVLISSLAATLVSRMFFGSTVALASHGPAMLSPSAYAAALLIGIGCAIFGIAVMQGATLVERGARKSGIPTFLRPAIGGLLVGILAIWSPQVLSSGHGALQLVLGHSFTPTFVVSVILLKSVASAVSIGSGFRGGLFFASLFLGALLGQAAALAGLSALPGAPDANVYAIVGMSALAVAIVGGPMTMTFLALEMTGDLPITALVLISVVASSLTVRKTFGYSFATWRLHLRGESIRSAHDIGWIRNLTVGGLMRRDVPTMDASISVARFRADVPLGSTQRVLLADEKGRYAGIVLVAEAHAEKHDAELDLPVREVADFRRSFLLPQMNAKEAMALFDSIEAEALAVVDSRESLKVLGLLTESHTLRRYSEELDRKRRELAGEM